jgi:allophanate hydrolase subunit 2
MYYLILKNTVVAGQRVQAGDVIEIAADEAASLLAMGRVEQTEAPQPKKTKSIKKTTNRAVTDFDTPEAE